MSILSRMLIAIGVDSSDMQAKMARMEKDLKKQFGSISAAAKSLSAIGKGLSLGLTTPLVFVGKALNDMASDARETSDKFNIAFGAMANKEREFTNILAASLGRSKQQMMTFMADNQALFSPLLKNSQAAAQMSEAISALAVDLASFNNVSDEDAFTALRSGISGEAEPMKKFGVILTENALKIEAQNLGLTKNIQKMSEAEKAALRFSAIMRNTSLAQGNAILTADSFANSSKALQGALADLGAEFGSMLIPYSLGLVTVTKRLVGVLNEADPSAKKVIVSIGLIAAAIGPTILLISGLLKAITTLQSAFVLLSSVMIKLQTVGINPIFGKIALAVTIFGVLSSAVKILAERFEPLQRALDGISRWFNNISLVKKFKETFGSLTQTANQAKDALDFGKGGLKKLGLEEYQKQLDEITSSIRSQLKGGAFEGASSGLDEAKKKVEGIKQAWLDYANDTKVAEVRNRLLGTGMGELSDQAALLSDKTSILERSLSKLLELGVSPSSKAILKMVSDLKSLRSQLEIVNATAQRVEGIRDMWAGISSIRNSSSSELEKARGELQALMSKKDSLEADLWKLENPDNPKAPKNTAAISNVKASIKQLTNDMTPLLKKVYSLEDQLKLADAKRELSSMQMWIDATLANPLEIAEANVKALEEAFASSKSLLGTAGQGWIKELEKELAEARKELAEIKRNSHYVDGGNSGGKSLQDYKDSLVASFNMISGSVSSWIKDRVTGLQAFNMDPGKGMQDAAASGIGGIVSLVGGLGKLAGGFGQLSGIMDKLNPVTAIVTAVMETLGPVLDTVIAPMTLVGTALATAIAPILKALFPIFKFLGQIVLGAATAIGNMWNGILEFLGSIPGLGFLKTFKMDVDALSDAQKVLTEITFDNASEKLKEYQATHKLTNAIDQATESMTNLPTGLKVAMYRFNSAGVSPSSKGLPIADGSSMSGGVAGSKGLGGAPTIVIQGDNYGYDDFARKVMDPVRSKGLQRSLRSRGVPLPA